MIKELRVSCGKCGNHCGTFYQQLGNIMFVSDDNGNVVDSEPKNPDALKAKIGDVMEFTLTDGEPVKAMCVDITGDTALYIFVDSLKEEYSMMNSDGEYPGWEDSDLRKKLNTEILARFPEEIRQNMIPFPNGDSLRIPTEKEIFGVNEYGEDEPEEVKQFEPMKYRRNRIAFLGLEGSWDWYWLANKSKRYATYACIVYANPGYANYPSASNTFGVRPLFGYRAIPTPSGGGKVYTETDAQGQSVDEATRGKGKG